MKTRIKGLKKGFTLVELLIVIALIAILSVAVLATINPIEQTNKARDSKFKNDAAEVLGALERYYASQNNYPWNVVGGGSTIAGNVNFVTSSQDPQFGVLAVGASGADFSSGAYGELINTSELKGSFRGKEPFIQGAKPEDMMYVFHNGLSGSNYVCFFPKSTANRSSTKQQDLKCLDTTAAVLYDYVPGATNCGVGQSGTTWDYAPGPNTPNLLCVPEGTIN